MQHVTLLPKQRQQTAMTTAQRDVHTALAPLRGPDAQLFRSAVNCSTFPSRSITCHPHAHVVTRRRVWPLHCPAWGSHLFLQPNHRCPFLLQQPLPCTCSSTRGRAASAAHTMGMWYEHGRHTRRTFALAVSVADATFSPECGNCVTELITARLQVLDERHMPAPPRGACHPLVSAYPVADLSHPSTAHAYKSFRCLSVNTIVAACGLPSTQLWVAQGGRTLQSTAQTRAHTQHYRRPATQ